MTQQTSGGRSPTTPTILNSGDLNDQYRFKLSDAASGLLAYITETGGIDSVTFTDGITDEDLVETLNTALGTLRHYRFVEFGLDGRSVKATKAGEDAVNRRIGVVYPFGKDGTIESYNKTFLTMTSSAKNAFLIARATTLPTWLDSSVNKRPLGSLFQAYCDVDIFRRLPRAVNMSLYQKLLNCVEYYVSKETPSRSATMIENQLSHWNIVLNTKIQDAVEEIGRLTPAKDVTFGSHKVLSIEEVEGTVMVLCRDIITGEDESFNLDDVPSPARCEVLRQS